MGEMIEFKNNGSSVRGYLAIPITTPAPGVLVLQEWWGLVPQITHTCDRLADEGFVALAPDLYHGEIAHHTEMDKAAHLMTTLPPDRAALDMRSAIDALLDHVTVCGDAVGVLGFCMGGMLALLVAAQQGPLISAVVPFYGAPLGDNAPDWSNLRAPVLGHLAENDDFFPLPAMRDLETTLHSLGKNATFHVYPGTGHAFANEENPIGTYNPDAGKIAWERSVDFLRAQLG